MKIPLIPVNVFSTNCPNVDQNKRFLKIVRINLMFDDGGG